MLSGLATSPARFAQCLVPTTFRLNRASCRGRRGRELATQVDAGDAAELGGERVAGEVHVEAVRDSAADEEGATLRVEVPDLDPGELGSPDAQEGFDPYAVLKTLDRHRVTYIVIGVFARVIHGIEELTRGVDIVPSTRPENLAAWRSDRDNAGDAAVAAGCRSR
jgi:hypothetical protein